MIMKKDSGKNRSDNKINCFKCINLQITWQPAFPYACKAIGFKSKGIPSLEVFKNSREKCQLYTPKK